MAASGIIPIFMAEIPGDSVAAEIIDLSKLEVEAGMVSYTPSTPWTVIAVTAHFAGTPNVCKALKSTCKPAAQLLSEAETIRTGANTELVTLSPEMIVALAGIH